MGLALDAVESCVSSTYLEDVDVVELQPLQGLFDRREDPLKWPDQ